MPLQRRFSERCQCWAVHNRAATERHPVTSEVFRFVTVRPPQDVNVLQPTAGANIDLGIFPTSFADTLRTQRGTGNRADMIATATALVHSTTFVDSPKKIDKSYLDFGLAVRGLTDQNFFSGAGAGFNTVLKTDPAALGKTDASIALYGRIHDRLVAAT